VLLSQGGNSLLECTVFGSIVGNKLAEEIPARREAEAAQVTGLTRDRSKSIDRWIDRYR